MHINEQNIGDVQADIEGPAGTPYEGAVFRMRLNLCAEFPAVPPRGAFLTKIFHPNVSKAGEICVNVLKKDWAPELGLRHVLMIVRCLLIQPFPDSALNEEAGKLLLEDYAEYAKHARLMAAIHAAPPKRPMPLTTSGANAGRPADKEATKEDAQSPLLKKAKGGAEGSKAPAAAAKPAAAKKALKRL